MFGVEKIGNYDVRNLGDGKYSIALNNGNIGARIGTEADVQALRDKYNRKVDTFEKSGQTNPIENPEPKKHTGLKIGLAALLAAGIYFLTRGKVKNAGEIVDATEKATEKVAEKTTEKVVEQVTEKTSEKVAEKTATKATEKVAEKTAENTTEKASEKVTEKVTKEAPKASKQGTEIHQPEISEKSPKLTPTGAPIIKYTTANGEKFMAREVRLENGYTCMAVSSEANPNQAILMNKSEFKKFFSQTCERGDVAFDKYAANAKQSEKTIKETFDTSKSYATEELELNKGTYGQDIYNSYDPMNKLDPLSPYYEPVSPLSNPDPFADPLEPLINPFGF